MSAPILRYFDHAHLRADLQAIAKPIHDLAHQLDKMLPESAEKSAGLRKLLEGKDALVRAGLDAAALDPSRASQETPKP